MLDELHRLIARERAADARRATASARDARTCSGVAWSGLAPAPYRPREAAELQQAARERLAALEAFRATPKGRLLQALAAAQAAAERAREALSRGGPADASACAAAVTDLATHAALASEVVDDGVGHALSAVPCATNTVSSSPSTASPASSAP